MVIIFELVHKGRGKKIDSFLEKVLDYGWVGVKSPPMIEEPEK